MERLQELSEVLVYAAQASLLHANVVEPVMNRAWNNLMVGVLREGSAYKPSVEEIGYLEFVFLVGLPIASVGELYKVLYSRMSKKYGRGNLSACFLREKNTYVSYFQRFKCNASDIQKNVVISSRLFCKLFLCGSS